MWRTFKNMYEEKKKKNLKFEKVINILIKSSKYSNHISTFFFKKIGRNQFHFIISLFKIKTLLEN